MKKALFLFLSFLLLSCGSNDEKKEFQPDTVNFPQRITFEGIGSIGIFDPSVTLDTSTNTLWMSYSEVHPSVQWPDANPEVVSQRLASSPDGGKNWTDSGVGKE